ncbi:MAG: UDP-3-O-acyl-N-acetylglucosamine deacetylase [Bacteroidales bacterium]|nr:UDP-3-O-acyl-N-acetylglucosamine deacetylase [Bacteroidales bacterium]
MKQSTLKKSYSFKGKGLHTGKPVTMTVKPAPENTGIVFVRTDIPQRPVIEALAENVSKTDRSTSLCKDGIAVYTVEHILSALTGLGVDNAIIELDNIEVPIMDGSARKYAILIGKDGTLEQDAPRRIINIDKPIEITDPSGAYVKIEPADKPDYDLTIDFGSHVLGVQTAHWDPEMDYISQIAPCRTFCFFHEVEFLLANNLIKGGDIYNAIVVVERPISGEQLQMVRDRFEMQELDVTPKGYLNNIKLHFPNECGRHKMLDLIGDLRLCGGFLNAKVTAYKSGHTINTAAAKAIEKAVGLK